MLAPDIAQSGWMPPYREPAPALLCPRCQRSLSEASAEVATCSQCHGVWLPARVISQWFGDDDWPRGTSMWWHSRVACPRCAQVPGSAPQVMLARNVAGVLVDRCARHGVWLDAGEVARLLAQPALGDAEALRALRTRVEVAAPASDRAAPAVAAVSAAGDEDRLALERQVTSLQAEVDARRQELAELERLLESKRTLLASERR